MYAEYGSRSRAKSGCRSSRRRSGSSRRRAFLRDLGSALGLEARSRSVHPARKEDDARRLARHLALDAQRLLRQRSDRDRRAADVQGRPDVLSGRGAGAADRFSAYRTGPESAPNEDVREALRESSPSPMIVFGSINERMIMAQEKLPSLFLQCSFPARSCGARRARRSSATPARSGSCSACAKRSSTCSSRTCRRRRRRPERADGPDARPHARRAGGA